MAHQLAVEEREVISQMRYAGDSQSAIARRLSRHKSTISRELRRNSGGEGCSVVAAQSKASRRRQQRPLEWMIERPEVNEAVRRGLSLCWSPDQIAGRLRRQHGGDSSRRVSYQSSQYPAHVRQSSSIAARELSNATACTRVEERHCPSGDGLHRPLTALSPTPGRSNLLRSSN